MIQTQLLKADQPYQIISAGGQVGIQVATLIVTEDKMAEDGSYVIDTHSHPVVNYASKEGLTEAMKYYDGDPRNEYVYTQRLQPEGAVWNKIEVRDVRVLGLVGAKNLTVDMATFVSLVPSIASDDPSVATGGVRLWGEHTNVKIRNLLFGLERVGLECAKNAEALPYDDITKNLIIELSIDRDARVERMVRVDIREADWETWPPIPGIAFRCRLGENPVECMTAIVKCMRELDQQFLRAGDNLRFVSNRFSEPTDESEKLLEEMTEQVNAMWKNRYGLG